MRSIFSTIVILALALFAVSFFMPLAYEYLYAYEAHGGLQWTGFGAKITLDGPVLYIYGLFYLTASVGLLLFKRWARTLFLLLVLVSVACTPFLGLSVVGGYEALVSYILVLAQGAILALVYLSGIGSEFELGT